MLHELHGPFGTMGCKARLRLGAGRSTEHFPIADACRKAASATNEITTLRQYLALGTQQLFNDESSATDVTVNARHILAVWWRIMAVLLETSAGDLVIDLLVDHAPKLCEK